MFYLAREVGKFWRCSCWEKGNLIMINEFAFGQNWKIWPSPLSLYSTFTFSDKIPIQRCHFLDQNHIFSQPKIKFNDIIDDDVNYQLQMPQRLTCKNLKFILRIKTWKETVFAISFNVGLAKLHTYIWRKFIQNLKGHPNIDTCKKCIALGICWYKWGGAGGGAHSHKVLI